MTVLFLKVIKNGVAFGCEGLYGKHILQIRPSFVSWRQFAKNTVYSAVESGKGEIAVGSNVSGHRFCFLCNEEENKLILKKLNEFRDYLRNKYDFK